MHKILKGDGGIKLTGPVGAEISADDLERKYLNQLEAAVNRPITLTEENRDEVLGNTDEVVQKPKLAKAKWFTNKGFTQTKKIGGKMMSDKGMNLASGLSSVISGVNDYLTKDDYRNSANKNISAVNGVVGQGLDSLGLRSPWGKLAQGAGQTVGRLIGGKNRMQGAGSAIASGVSTVASAFGPIGWGVSAAIELISGAGIGQKRAIEVKDFTNEWADPYMGSAKEAASSIATFSGRKAGTFDFGMRKNANKKLRRAANMQNIALDAINVNQNMSLAANASLQDTMNSYNYSGSVPQLVLAKSGIRFPELDKAKSLIQSWEVKKFQNGGVIEKNVIPTGALHKNKHHIEEIRPELEGQITEKGIPVVSSDVAENVRQIAEVEAGEITFVKSVTEQIEEFYESYKEDESDELAIELGKFLVEQILHNTIDKDKVIKKTE